MIGDFVQRKKKSVLVYGEVYSSEGGLVELSARRPIAPCSVGFCRRPTVTNPGTFEGLAIFFFCYTGSLLIFFLFTSTSRPLLHT